MKNRLIALAAATSLGLLATVAFADNPMVGGAAMFPNKDIVDNAVNSKITQRLSPLSRRQGSSKL